MLCIRQQLIAGMAGQAMSTTCTQAEPLSWSVTAGYTILLKQQDDSELDATAISKAADGSAPVLALRICLSHLGLHQLTGQGSQSAISLIRLPPAHCALAHNTSPSSPCIVKGRYGSRPLTQPAWSSKHDAVLSSLAGIQGIAMSQEKLKFARLRFRCCTSLVVLQVDSRHW